MATFENDWELAASLLEPFVKPDYQGFPLIVPAFAQLHMWHYICSMGMIKLFRRKEQQGEDTTLYERTLKDVRTQIDVLGRIFPGTFKCAGIIYISRISLLLKDRPFSGELKKLKKAVDYAVELDALPLDVLALKCEVCRWEGNVTGLAEGIKDCDKIGYKLLSMEYNAILANMKSGKEKIDLTFVPKKRE